ncbi:uncharacterized protein [Primulina huaijiensis]|uniref:uncharacterized protein n=1 Tax=Primulina huaijiensis TaxID=1492673 RepID=UPI003CC74E11
MGFPGFIKRITILKEMHPIKKKNYYVLRHGISTENPIFSWADHPSLITDAVENGWSGFAFTTLISSPSVKSAKSLLAVCAAGDPIDAEIAWEVCQGSADFMQKIILNPGLKKIIASVSSSMGVVSVIRTPLPLPGPHLGNSSFPQEAHFEITILSCNENIHDHLVDKERKYKSGEKIKLIGEDFNAKMNSDSLNHVNGRNKIEDMKLGGKKDGKNEVICLSVGFTGGATIPFENSWKLSWICW